MKMNVNEYIFRDAFISMGRGDNFSYAGLCALYEYLVQLEEDLGVEFELDVIGLCCEYTEYVDFNALLVEYPNIEDYEDLKNTTTVIDIDGDSFIIQAF